MCPRRADRCMYPTTRVLASTGSLPVQGELHTHRVCPENAAAGLMGFVSLSSTYPLPPLADPDVS